MNTRSLRFRLTAWYASLLATALLLFGVSVYIGLQRYLEASATRTLSEQAHSIESEITAEYSRKGPEWLGREIEEAYAPESTGNFVRVTRNGIVVYQPTSSKDEAVDPARVPGIAVPSASRSTRQVVVVEGHRLVLFGLRFTDSTRNQFLVETGVSYQSIDRVLHGLLLTLGIYMPFIVSLAIAGGYWLMRRSLQPVDEITTRAEGITSTNLSERLPVIKTGDELERLSTSLNGMISRLEDAFQHINRFSADASHELRTPLTILQLELEGIAQHRQLPVDVADQIGSALEETQRLAHIVENLMTISRMDAGEVRMENTVLDLADLVISTVEQMKLLADERFQVMNCRATRVYVEGDRSRLKQLVVNLIDNAIKYTPEHGDIDITVQAAGHIALLEITDTGVGIPQDALPHVFERFYRADKARSRESGGAGLGLAIVKAICSAHGGQITITSAEGLGTRFRVELPLTDVDSIPQQLDRTSAISGRQSSRIPKSQTT